jgi:hypothetical protein
MAGRGLMSGGLMRGLSPGAFAKGDRSFGLFDSLIFLIITFFFYFYLLFLIFECRQKRSDNNVGFYVAR